jgi:hypothetical protein
VLAHLQNRRVWIATCDAQSCPASQRVRFTGHGLTDLAELLRLGWRVTITRDLCPVHASDAQAQAA